MLLLLAGCSGPGKRAVAPGAAEKARITIGIAVPGASYLPIYPAVDDGLLAKEGPFFDIGIESGRYKERWPAAKYWTPLYVATYLQWKPA